jgi:2-methylcitrate dehydratase PrpD
VFSILVVTAQLTAAHCCSGWENKNMSIQNAGAVEQPSCFARFLLDPPAIGEETRGRATKVIADTFAAMLAGARSEVSEPLLAYVAGSGGFEGLHPVFGTSHQATAEAAALINGTFAAALEFDDVLSMMPGHPSAVVVSALSASDAASNASGREVINAYVIGIETGARLAQAMTLGHYKKGFHATGTLCLFSALGALAYIEKLSAEQIDHAIGIAASLSSGIQGNFGTMTKSLHSGLAASNALRAVNLAKAGFTARSRIFETEGGYFDTYGVSESSLALIEGKFGNPWIVDSPRIALKRFPCCYATHRGIDAVLELKKELGITAQQVKKATCLVPPGGLIPLKFEWPVSRFEALFSMPYAVAVSLLHERPVLSSFTTDTVTSEEVNRLRPLIDVREDAVCVADYPDFESKSYGSRGEVRVMIETTDGIIASRTVLIAPGHPDRELTWEQLDAKFDDCATSAGFSHTFATETFALLRELDQAVAFGPIVSRMNKSEV